MKFFSKFIVVLKIIDKDLDSISDLPLFLLFGNWPPLLSSFRLFPLRRCALLQRMVGPLVCWSWVACILILVPKIFNKYLDPISHCFCCLDIDSLLFHNFHYFLPIVVISYEEWREASSRPLVCCWGHISLRCLKLPPDLRCCRWVMLSSFSSSSEAYLFPVIGALFLPLFLLAPCRELVPFSGVSFKGTVTLFPDI